MKATVEKLEDSFAHLAIEVDENRFQKSLDESYHRLSYRVRVPGFRKGRVPRQILEMRIGKETLIEDALKSLIPEMYVEAVKETGIDPLDEPEFTVTDAEEGKPMKFTAKVLVRPEVRLPDYKQIRIEREIPEVSDEDVDRQIRVLRENQAVFVTVDRDTVAEGDYVLAKVSVTSDGQPVDLGIGEDPVLVQAGNEKGDVLGIGKGIVGLKTGEEADIEITLPEGSPDEDFAGKQGIACVEVEGIREKEIPELTDEFAQAVGGFESVDAMRQGIREIIERSVKERFETEYINKVVDKITEEAEVDVPEILVEREIDRTLRNLEASLVQQGLSLEGYLESCGLDNEALRSNYRDEAYTGVKAEFVLDAVAKAEGFEASDDEVNEKVKVLSEYRESPFDDMKELLRQSGRIRQIESAIIREKTRKRLAELAAGE
ncbi:MAG: trigger factor [Firmicutes bacterium]|nr:trigger factor [Bacillota bacterium]